MQASKARGVDAACVDAAILAAKPWASFFHLAVKHMNSSNKKTERGALVHWGSPKPIHLTQRKLFRKTCSDELFILGGFFRVDFPPERGGHPGCGGLAATLSPGVLQQAT